LEGDVVAGNQHQIADEGDTITLRVVWRNAAGQLATPDSTLFAQRTPTQTATGGTNTTTGWTTVSPGVQTRNVTLNSPGLWRFEARAAGNGVFDAQTVTVDAQRSRVRV
jgi:hypothetical protein